MASDKEYLAFILDQLSGLEEITYKAMMGDLPGMECQVFGKGTSPETDAEIARATGK